MLHSCSYSSGKPTEQQQTLGLVAGSTLWRTPPCKDLPDGAGKVLARHGFHQHGINLSCVSGLGVNERTIPRAQDHRHVRADTPELTYQDVARHGGHIVPDSKEWNKILSFFSPPYTMS